MEPFRGAPNTNSEIEKSRGAVPLWPTCMECGVTRHTRAQLPRERILRRARVTLETINAHISKDLVWSSSCWLVTSLGREVDKPRTEPGRHAAQERVGRFSSRWITSDLPVIRPRSKS